MPTARDALLNAALTALDTHPWTRVRMVDVAAVAGVSRQTLYNEFGTKDGLARALVRRESDAYLAGVARVLDAAGRHGADPGDRFAAATAWTLHSARRSPLVRAALTGCRGERLPAGAGRGELTAALREVVAGTLHGSLVCEAAVRLAVSYVMVPAASDEDACAQVARLVRGLSTASFAT